MVAEITGETKVTFTAKELFDRLEGRLDKRLDKQDDVLLSIDRRLDNTATKDDVRELHQRIDGVVERVKPLEDQAASERAIEANRSRVKGNWTWVFGIAGTLAIVASVLVAVLH